VRRDNPPTLRHSHPGLALHPQYVAAGSIRLRVRHREVAAEGRDDGFFKVRLMPEIARARRNCEIAA
jgi:hypothetical protein